MSDVLASRKYITQGDGIKKKRNGYKIVDSKYNKLYINMDKLLNEMVVEAAIDGDIVYSNTADKDTINLLTKRYNSKKVQ